MYYVTEAAARVMYPPNRDGVAMEFVVPMKELKSGQHIAQMNLIDDDAGSFAFPRLKLRSKMHRQRQLRRPMLLSERSTLVISHLKRARDMV